MEQKKMKLRIKGEYQAAEDSWAKVEHEHECESVACVTFDGDTLRAGILGVFSTVRAYQTLKALQREFGREIFDEALAALMLLDGFVPEVEGMPDGAEEEEQANERKAAAACGEDNDGEEGTDARGAEKLG